MGVTMTRIARESGVSLAVVSRLLRGDPTLRISEARRNQIMQATDRLGDVRIRPQSRKLTHTVVAPVSAVFSGMLQNLVIETEHFRSFEAKLKEHGLGVHFSFFNPGEELSVCETVMAAPRTGDGLLLLASMVDQKLADLLRKFRFPHVSFDYCAERFYVNTVHVHSAEGARLAVEHLYNLGHRRIGFLGTEGRYRYSLMVAAMVDLRLPIDDSFNCWIPDPNSTNDQWRVVTVEPFRRWLEAGPKATAMIAMNDAVALGGIDAMNQLGMRLGTDFSLVGHDNLEVRRSLNVDHPVLTTVDNPTNIIGRRAAELLLNQILHGQNLVVHERIPAELIIRSSTGKPKH